MLQTQQFILGEQVTRFEQLRGRPFRRLPCSGMLIRDRRVVAGAGRRRSGAGYGRNHHSLQLFCLGKLDSARRSNGGAGRHRPRNFNLSSKAVEQVLDSPEGKRRTRHFAGSSLWPMRRLDGFLDFGKERGLKLIEDAAQAWGAEWEGTKAGGLGDIAAFSFYPTKNMSAAGDAGMVTTNSDELGRARQMLRQHGMRRRYYHDEIGWNARMDGFQGAILEVKMRYIDGWNHARRTVAKRYHALFHAAGLAEAGPYPSHGVVLPHEVAGSRHVWHQYVIRTRKRDALRDFLAMRQDRFGDLLPAAAAYAGCAEVCLVTGKATFLKPSAPPAKFLRCPSSPNSVKTSSRPWSARLRNF